MRLARITWSRSGPSCDTLSVMLVSEDHRKEVGATAVLELIMLAGSWLDKCSRSAQASEGRRASAT
ncbi:hypothetical protein WI78_26365 [Burkholderia ubonensis]|nr:hypothetical protein WI78_26365 [Burkholderia ubonensis]